MAITENVLSRNQHITAVGETITQVFDCTDSDWSNWLKYKRPIIGTRWTPARQDLRVTDIRTTWINNTTTKVIVTYSTQGYVDPIGRANKISSQREVFDYSITPQSDNVFFNTDNDSKDWSVLWEAYKSGTPVPPRYKPESIITHQRYMNLSYWNFNDVKNLINTVNKYKYLPTWAYRPKPKERISLGLEFTDVGKWLFAGFNSEKVGYKSTSEPNYEVALILMYLDDGWNTPYGITDTKAYEIKDWKDLPIPKDNYDGFSIGLR